MNFSKCCKYTFTFTDVCLTFQAAINNISQLDVAVLRCTCATANWLPARPTD